MSFWVSLLNDKGNYEFVRTFAEGGTQTIGGSNEASLNITYNYSPFYYEHLNKDEGLRWLDGKIAKDTIEPLEKAVQALGTDRANDYWESTPGNAGYALFILLSWAKQYPDSEWAVH